MTLALDELGRPILIIRDQDEKKRVKGIDAHKNNILAASSIADTLKTSLGPKGMDKIIISPDQTITVTNDGATILDKMEVEHQCAKLLVELSKSQDNEIGDGTTGIIILAGSLLKEAYKLLQKGLHPLRIAEGFEMACNIALQRINEIATPIDIFADSNHYLLNAAMTALSSKVIRNIKQQLAQIAVDAVLSVADINRKDVNFDLIKIEGKAGGRLEETCLIHGIVLDKDLSHSQMKKLVKNARIAILTCPFEPPRPKTKHKLDIKSEKDYKALQSLEQKYFVDMVDAVEKSGANFVICQWGFDDEANHLLMKKGIPAVRWVGGVELELIAIATGGRIVPKFELLTSEKLGKAGTVREITIGTDKNQMTIIEDCANSKTVTICVKGGNNMIVAEAERCIHDAICCVRNLIKDNRILSGGGAVEIAAAISVEAEAEKVESVEQYAIRAFADALLSIPEALAENSGLNSILSVGKAISEQIEKSNPNIGLDCIKMCIGDMMKNNIYESFLSKQHQISLATQVVKMILKINDIIGPSDMSI